MRPYKVHFYPILPIVFILLSGAILVLQTFRLSFEVDLEPASDDLVDIWAVVGFLIAFIGFIVFKIHRAGYFKRVSDAICSPYRRRKAAQVADHTTTTMQLDNIRVSNTAVTPAAVDAGEADAGGNSSVKSF